jgi:hypothetical protein
LTPESLIDIFCTPPILTMKNVFRDAYIHTEFSYEIVEPFQLWIHTEIIERLWNRYGLRILFVTEKEKIGGVYFCVR